MAGNDCYHKAVATGEPVFTLRAQDETSPEVVLTWIVANFGNPNLPEEKIRDAFEIALKMRQWPDKKSAD